MDARITRSAFSAHALKNTQTGAESSLSSSGAASSSPVRGSIAALQEIARSNPVVTFPTLRLTDMAITPSSVRQTEHARVGRPDGAFSVPERDESIPCEAVIVHRLSVPGDLLETGHAWA